MSKKVFILTIIFLFVTIFFSIIVQAQVSSEDLGLEKASDTLLNILQNKNGVYKPDLKNADLDILSNQDFQVVGYMDSDTTINGVNYLTYYVKPGDSLYKIARDYEVKVIDIKSMNNMQSDYLIVGQELKIPLDIPGTNFVYIVKPGDSLYKIAQEFNTSITKIKSDNKLNSNYLNVGQSLKISIENPNSNFTYYVKPGDSLFTISRKFEKTIEEIKTANDLQSNYLYIGQKLSIPISSPDTDYNNRITVTKEELELLARAVYSEARGEPYRGQVAVAAVIINRLFSSLFPNTIRGVIFQPWQFSAVHDGQFWLEPNEQAYNAVRAALGGWDPTNGAIYYYNPKTASSRWVFYRKVIIKIGQHYFAV